MRFLCLHLSLNSQISSEKELKTFIFRKTNLTSNCFGSKWYRLTSKIVSLKVYIYYEITAESSVIIKLYKKTYCIMSKQYAINWVMKVRIWYSNQIKCEA